MARIWAIARQMIAEGIRMRIAVVFLLLIAVIGTIYAGVRQSRYQRQLTDIQGRISGMVLQIITGITKLRIAGVEGRVFAFWAREFGQQRSLSFRARGIANGLTVFNAATTGSWTSKIGAVRSSVMGRFFASGCRVGRRRRRRSSRGGTYTRSEISPV